MTDYDKGHIMEEEVAPIDVCSCKEGYEEKDGVCQPVAVTIDLEINDALTLVEAGSGRSIVEISGVAFHEGPNKNNWEITRRAAENISAQMINADVTLYHPDPDDIGFGRNMDGTVDKAVVGVIKEATVVDASESGLWSVHYTAHIYRPELFEALESGLWLRDGYGVSIGGFGIPTKADEDGMVFDDDFTFDHLAIVHRPAYERANIESVRRVEIEAEVEEEIEKEVESASTFKYQSMAEGNQHNQEATIMTEEQIDAGIEEGAAFASEIETLKAELILKNAEIDSFVATQEAQAEEARQELVEEADSLGLKGHEELSADVIASLINSWQEANPTPEQVVMEPVSSAPTPAVAEETVEASESRAVVANYLNGVMVKSDEEIYSRCWNAWARAWNDQLTTEERKDDGMRAKYYDEIKKESGN